MPMNAIAVHPQGFPHFCLISKMSPQESLAGLERDAGAFRGNTL